MMKTFKDKSLIIFDWDGTLMDSVGLIVAAMRHAAEQNGLTVSDEATKSIIGIALVDAFPLLFPHDSDKHGAILASYSDYYIKHCDNDKLFDGIKELIKCLHTQGKILAVATGKKRQGLARVLPNSSIEPFFTISCCADETAGKPNPLMMRTGINLLGGHSQDTVIIGDRMDTDIVAGIECGLDTVLVLSGVSTRETLRTYAYRDRKSVV